MIRDVLTEAELKLLLGDDETPAPSAGTTSVWSPEDRKILHALVRNQLRLLHMIEEMQSELRLLKAITASRENDGGAIPGGSGTASPHAHIAASLEPLPFLKTRTTSAPPKEEPDEPSISELSRKERFKRKTLKSFW